MFYFEKLNTYDKTSVNYSKCYPVDKTDVTQIDVTYCTTAQNSNYDMTHIGGFLREVEI